ncbi:MAG: P-type conjugative transfer protein TrbJ [Desulfocapsaceae bacterium]|nr:P-type conjugative transfer protein TrbJ [Desulfocapsaceae bacterium]
MKLKKTVIIIVTALLLSTSAAPSRAIFCSNCSTIIQQILDQITNIEQLSELISQTEQSMRQTEQQITMVNNMLQNTKKLPSAVNGLTQLAQLTVQLNVQRGDLTSLAQIFNNQYPERTTFSNINNQQLQSYQDNWSQEVDRASQATFQLSGKQLADLQDSGGLQDHINQLTSTPDGQMQAIQAGNQLSVIQIQEARALRELVATNTQSMVSSQMKAEKNDELRMEQWRKATAPGDHDFSSCDKPLPR